MKKYSSLLTLVLLIALAEISISAQLATRLLLPNRSPFVKLQARRFSDIVPAESTSPVPVL